MRVLKAFLVPGLLIQLLALLLVQHSTSAQFTDQSQSTTNAFAAKTMRAPALTATASGATVSLAWTNPDALSGPNASFIVQRASGDCTAPGVFTTLSGSPFATTTLATTDAPGANGAYCYALQSALYSWRSSTVTAAATVRVVTVPKLRLLSADPGVCGAVGSLSTMTGASNVVISARSSVIFAAAPTEGLTNVPAGAHVLTIALPGVGSPASVAYTAEVGTCAGTTFTSLGNASDSLVLDKADQTRVVNVRVATGVTLNAGTYLALRVTNNGSANLKLTGNQAESTLEAPAGAGY
ncbi:MAG: hypothetical protein U0446_01715 [Dehalococcoidia bacterium]